MNPDAEHSLADGERVHDRCEQEDHATVPVDVGLAAERSHVEIVEGAIEQVAERAHVRVRERPRRLIDVDVEDNVVAHIADARRSCA